MCPFAFSSGNVSVDMICFGIKVFLLIWIIFVPIAVTARLEKIIKLLEEAAKKQLLKHDSPPDGLSMDNRQGFLCLMREDYQVDRKNLIKFEFSYTMIEIEYGN